MIELFKTLSEVSPLAVIALLGYVVYLLVAKKGPVASIGSNHLHQVPEIVEALGRIEAGVGNISKDLSYLIGRLNGSGHRD